MNVRREDAVPFWVTRRPTLMCDACDGPRLHRFARFVEYADAAELMYRCETCSGERVWGVIGIAPQQARQAAASATV